MRFVEFQSFILGGATRPCLCRADTEDSWVIKVHGNPLGTKAILNEYALGKLAEMIQLPWPKVELGEVTDGIKLRLGEEGLMLESYWVVGIQYIDGFRVADWPKNSSPTDIGFDKVNAQHIRELFGGKELWGQAWDI